MCGIVAIISKQKFGFTFKDKTLFLQMLISDMFRGMDSTGVFGVNKYGNVDMVKDASAAAYFVGKKETNKVFDNVVTDYHILVGHNRKATMGKIESENAHPFIEGNTILVHNGTLTNHRKLADKTVDSHAICHHIEENGYKSALKQIEGAYALIWYDAGKKTLFFSRNAERPLYLVETAERIYLASEGKMLDWLLDRNDISKYTIQNVPTDKVFKYSLETMKLECESKPKKAEPPKNHGSWKNNQYIPSGQSVTNHQPQSSGLLALVHSSTPSSTEAEVATIETYKSGEMVKFKVVDFDMGEKSCKLLGETLDGMQTNITHYLDLKIFSQYQIDAYINAEELIGKIASITSKRGLVTIYLSSVMLQHKIIWKDITGNSVDREELKEAGGQCFCCNEEVNTREKVSKANITTNASGKVMYILCEGCADQNVYHNSAFGIGYC